MDKKDFDKKEDIVSKKDTDDIALEEKIRRLRKALKRSKLQLAEMEENWKRALADYKNLERRTIDEKEESAKFANFVLVSELILVCDNLEMLKKHSSDQGLKMIANQFVEILKTAGLEKQEVLGKNFDETYMEAIDTRTGEENKVMEEILPAYKFKGKLVRPAKVVVGK